ncbi:MAG: hypothetical protein NTY96_09440 [Bacteroidetes bacterium]|nr:hypothetical protein [Bacteroidota bacterium]
MQDILQQLNNVYFWDVDYSKLDPVKSKRLIIERIFTLGNLQEIKTVTEFYGKKEVINTLCSLNYLEPKNLNFVSFLFKIPKKDFKCYQRRRSTVQHWI